MLDARLKAAASLVRKDSACVDVGTDHAYLAVYLYEQGITKKITACDIREKPLKAARQTLEKHLLQDKIELVLSDGLKNIKREQALDIIICGMGGELIESIILSCPYAKEEHRLFILQPMTKIPYLRTTLCKNGFKIIKEIPVIDKQHTYSVLQVKYTGEPTVISDLYAIVGEIPQNDSYEAFLYIKRQKEKTDKILNGFLKSGKNENEIKSLKELSENINLLLEEKYDGYR